MTHRATSGINFGAGFYVPADRLSDPPAGSDADVDIEHGFDTGGKRLSGRIRRRSGKFTDTHRHREDHEPNPFIVSLRDAKTSSVRHSRMGYVFGVMKTGATISVEIDDMPGSNFLFRRFLTPHILQGDVHIDISDMQADFLHRKLRFELTAQGEGLVRVLALDASGRCRGELVVSIKDFSKKYSVQFVRVHNGKTGGRLKNASTLTNTQLTTMLQDAADLLRSQTGLSFFALGAPVDRETEVDLSHGLTDTEFKKTFATARHGSAQFTVLLFSGFKKPFLNSNETVGAAPMGQFLTSGFGVVALSDEATAKGRPEISLAHEICHTLIDPVHFADLGFDTGGHYQDKSARGLMRGGQNSPTLRWRDLNVINPSGLGPGGLADLKTNDSLWRNSGS